MKSAMGYVVLGLLFVASGYALWSAAIRQERLADAERDLASLQFQRAAVAFDALSQSGGLIGLVPGLDAGVTSSRLGAVSRYWQSNYGEVGNDPALALLAANAAYRDVEREGGPWNVVVGKLDTVVKRYADVLRSEPENEDASYNYEFAVRRRAALTASKQKVAPAGPDQSGRTLHGEIGAPPEGSDVKQFKMIVPMLPQERMEAEQAGRGRNRIRKG